MLIFSGSDITVITTPSDLADIWEWWEPSREAFSDNDAIGTMAGQFAPGSGHNWTQGTAGSKPTYKASIVNGHGVARFDGSDDVMGSVDPTALTAVHMFVVIKMDSNTPAAGKGGQWSFGNVGGSQYPDAASPTNIASDAFRSTLRSFSKSGIDVAQWRVVEIVSVQSTLEWTFRLDGTVLDTVTGGFVHQSSGFISLGRSGPFDSNWLDGDVAGMYMCGGKLSTPDRGGMINYLNSRFGLSAS